MGVSLLALEKDDISVVFVYFAIGVGSPQFLKLGCGYFFPLVQVLLSLHIFINGMSDGCSAYLHEASIHIKMPLQFALLSAVLLIIFKS